jgi:Helicase conserved C-terminal domain
VTVHADSDHEQRRLERWKIKNGDLLGMHQRVFWPQDDEEAPEDKVEDFLNEDVLSQVDKLNPAEFDVGAILDDTFEDLNQLADFLHLLADAKPERDDKLRALIKLLKTDSVLKREKVIIFSEFADTARYLEQHLRAAGITQLERIDGDSSQAQRSDVIQRFSPYYNESSSEELRQEGLKEIRVLISTDILSEGLNLQDATRLINYDLHWNPVRLMQRIGRVDRRMNPQVEARILADHPDQRALRGKVEFWNFLPPDELEELLRLFRRVTNKTLIISRTLGIEGRKLLRPDDDYDPIREMNEQFDGTLSDTEMLRLEYNDLVSQHPELAARLPALPNKIFSGKHGPDPEGGARGAFFCYRIPRPDPALPPTENGQPRWSDAAGFTVWIFSDLDGKHLLTDESDIADLIRCEPDTPRHCELDRAKLSELRTAVEKKITADHLRSLQAPLGVMPVLKCWMEVN